MEIYPKTYHLPFSPGITDDDRVISLHDFSLFKRHSVVAISEKMDGGCITGTESEVYARRPGSKKRVSQEYVRNFFRQIQSDIPTGMRIVVENVHVLHNLHYTRENGNALDAFVLGHSIWEDNICLSYADTLDWFNLLGITPVPLLYIGPYSDDVVLNLIRKLDTSKTEGFVVRNAAQFSIEKPEDFRLHVLKWVRSEHNNSDDWENRPIVYNELKG